MRIRLRLPDGSTRDSLPPSHESGAAVTCGSLLTSAAGDWFSQADPRSLTLLGGYPPRPVPWEDSIEPGNYVIRGAEVGQKPQPEQEKKKEFNLADYIVDETTAPAIPERPKERAGTLASYALPSTLTAPRPTQRVQPGVLKCVARKVPDDNSCLFSALAYLTAPTPSLRRDASTGDRLRMAVRDFLLGELATSGLVDQAALDKCPVITDAMLGRPVREYANWISDARHWGGEIELSILAPLLGCEICVLNAQPNNSITYGEGQGHPSRVYMIYDGLHYDPVALTIDTGGAGDFGEADDVTVTFPGDPEAEILARKLCDAFHTERRFTNTAEFTLRCGDCGAGIVGEKGAQEHCRETGHQSFQEYIPYK